ncbi:hypothetical protein DFH06DRAFT_1148078 [Mycena polygramma]|nr:hypothetical protein DFH06DRAFT_1148078 [Mycena polygramma]
MSRTDVLTIRKKWEALGGCVGAEIDAFALWEELLRQNFRHILAFSEGWITVDAAIRSKLAAASRSSRYAPCDSSTGMASFLLACLTTCESYPEVLACFRETLADRAVSSTFKSKVAPALSDWNSRALLEPPGKPCRRHSGSPVVSAAPPKLRASMRFKCCLLSHSRISSPVLSSTQMSLLCIPQRYPPQGKPPTRQVRSVRMLVSNAWRGIHTATPPRSFPTRGLRLSFSSSQTCYSPPSHQVLVILQDPPTF